MRALTLSETRYVAGGVDTVDDIVVIGTRPKQSRDEIEQILRDMDSGGGVSGGGQSSGGGGGIVLGWILDRFGAAVDKYLDDKKSEASDREKALSDDFSPDDVQRVWEDGDGNTIWVMRNGSEFWDTNNNNTPDTWVKVTGNHTYVNRGEGWEMVN